MGQIFSNPTGDKDEKIKHVADLLHSSRQRSEVFVAIYSGRKPFKSMDEIGESVTNYNNRTYEAAAKLYAEDVVVKKESGGKLLYGKLDFYKANFPKIIRLSKNSKKLRHYPTKRNQGVTDGKKKVTFQLLSRPQAIRLYVDDIDSFKKIKKVKEGNYPKIHSVAERTLNRGICMILSSAEKNDWGGERNDIFAPIRLGIKRKAAAFALKGKGTRGPLTLNKMGHKGDQIQRLFESSAEVHILVYHDVIDERVHDQMQIMAIHKSVANGNKKIYYCLIEEDDLKRLLTAYANEFKL